MWIFKALVSSTGMVAQIESLRLALMHACLYVLGGFLVVLLLKWMVGTFAVLRWLRSSAFVPMLAIAAICTSLSAKFGLQNIFGFHHSQLPVTVGTVITPIDVTNGWRMAGESQGEEFAAMPTNAVVNEREMPPCVDSFIQIAVIEGLGDGRHLLLRVRRCEGEAQPRFPRIVRV